MTMRYNKFMTDIPSGWKQVDETLVLELKLKYFKQVIKLVNKISDVAENLGHHPDISIKNYNELTVVTTTHSINKLSSKDAELAQQINNLLGAN
jgi:4a-hydroxytetrahydrobiopterin dehydratase